MIESRREQFRRLFFLLIGENSAEGSFFDTAAASTSLTVNEIFRLFV
jgi:hypothetical protein